MNLLTINNLIIDNLQNYLLNDFKKNVEIEIETKGNNATSLYLVINNYNKIKNKVDYYQVFCKLVEKQNLIKNDDESILNKLLSNKFTFNGNSYFFGNSIDVLQRVGGNDFGLYFGLEFESQIKIENTEPTFILKSVEINVENDTMIINKEDKK